MVLFLPTSQEKYDEEGNMSGFDIFTKTSVYGYPDNQKSLDELLKMEIE